MRSPQREPNRLQSTANWSEAGVTPAKRMNCKEASVRQLPDARALGPQISAWDIGAL